jgi:plastocyanin
MSGRRSLPILMAIVLTPAGVTIGAGLAHGGVGPVVSSATDGASAAGTTHHVVHIRGLRFEPEVLLVAEGDTIVWINHDLVPHTVAAADSSWSSGGLAADGSWRHVVGTESETAYFCEYHPTMRGRIRVQ